LSPVAAMLSLTDSLPSLPLWLCSGNVVSASDFATLSGFILYRFLEVSSVTVKQATADARGDGEAMCFQIRSVDRSNGLQYASGNEKDTEQDG